MRYLKIKDNLYLTQLEVKQEEKKVEPVKTNHLFIIDRSGSMYSTLPSLIEDLIERVKVLPIGDIVSIAWFSSEGGEYNWIIKGFRIVEDADYNTLAKILRDNRRALNLTCFSEVLEDTKQVIIDLKLLSDKFSLCFLSDGYPVVSNYNMEENKIFKAINDIKGQINSTLLVGYGNYYNKELMSRMAEAFGGSLTHSSDLAKFKVSLCEFIENSKDAQGRIKVEVHGLYPSNIYFSINGSDIIIYQLEERKYINYLPTTKGKNWLFTLTATPIITNEDEEIILTDSNTKHSTSKLDSFIKGIYAASFLLVQKCKNDLALEILGTLGDKYLIDKVSNAFTIEEYGKTEEEIKCALTNPNRRFINGRDTSYLPAEDAFCLLDLFEILCQYKDSMFYPMHDSFDYKRIGAPSVYKSGYPEFEPALNAACRFSDLVWHECFLNLSVRARIPGLIRLNNGYSKLGLKKVFDTYVWRNYAIVKDGNLNVDKLPVSMNGECLGEILKRVPIEVIVDKIDFKNSVTVLNLSNIPIINRKIAKSYTSATNLFKLCVEELETQATMKILKWAKDELTPDNYLPSTGFEGLTDEQIKYLMNLGVTKSGYSPPSEKLPSTDYYYAKFMEINIANYSSLPSINKVKEKAEKIEKADPKKKVPTYTPSEAILKKNLDIFCLPLRDLNFYEEGVEKTRVKLAKIKSEIQRAKFAVILGNSWFDEFPKRDECEMKIGIYDLALRVDKKRVDY